MNCADCFQPIERCTCFGARKTLIEKRTIKLEEVQEWAYRHDLGDNLTDLEAAFDDARSVRL